MNQFPVSVVAMGTDVLHMMGDARLSPAQRLLSRMGLRRSGSISAKSRYLAAALLEMGVRVPIDVNYWGCDLARFSPGPRSEARARLGLPESAKIVLSPRACEPRLNIDLIVAAFPAILRRWPDALLVLIGRAESKYAAKIVAAIAQLGLGANVRLVGNLPANELPDYYRACDLVVSVGSSEGFPNTVLEVLACGVPVLAGDIPQIRELLSDGVNARICSIDVPGLETGMSAMLADPDAASRLAASGRLTALEFGDLDKNARRRADKLRELAAAGTTQGLLSVTPYRLLLRAYQLKRFALAYATRSG